MSGSSDYTTTPNLGLFKPNYNKDVGNWGNHLNSNADKIDAALFEGPGGAFLPVGGGTMDGPLYYTATNGTTPRSAQDRAADVVNVLDFGADPTGVADSSAAINAALATGKRVYLPRGTYLIRHQIVVTGAQALQGDGSATTLLVDGGFDPTVTTGVVVLTNTLNQLRPALIDLTIQFVQPPDIVTTATAASPSGNQITVASAAGIVAGMSLVNRTTSGSISAPVYQNGPAATTVTAIAGHVLTLNQNVMGGGVLNGDTLQFAAVRSMFKTLANGGTATPGGTGIQYPWAVYASPQGTMLLERVMISGAWNGVYVRGSSFQIEKLDAFAFNVGLDIDACHNFPSLIDYRFWPWGNRPDLGQRDALTNVYYDGATISANIGACDDLRAVNFQTWRGNLNITSAWTWGSFSGLSLDGDNTNLTVTAGSNAWLQISNFYSTNGPASLGKALLLNASNPKFRVTILGFELISAATDYAVVVQSGVLDISGGYLWDGLQGALTMIDVASAGTLYLSDTRLDASGPRTDTYIAATGTGVVNMCDCTFTQAAGAGGVGLAASSGATVVTNNVAWNGWGVTSNGTPISAYNTTLGSLSVTGPLSATGGGTFGGTFAGAPVWSGLVTHTAEVGFTGGVNFGSQAVASPADLSKHISLYGGGSGTIGFNVSPNQLNYVTPTGTWHVFYVNGVAMLTITNGNAAFSNGLNITAGGFQVTGNMGFNGAAKIARPTVTGAKGSNAALASLMTALAAYGLVTDTTTA